MYYYMFYTANTMSADNLAPLGAMASAGKAEIFHPSIKRVNYKYS